MTRVQGNQYSVHSRLIGEQVEVRIFADMIEVWYAQKKMETLPRLRGKGKHHVNYRHVIDWLVRKPGAFGNYRFQADLFPNSRSRMAFDALNEMHAKPVATKHYLWILELAARENESIVDSALQSWLDGELALGITAFKEHVLAATSATPVPREILISEVNLVLFDALLSSDSLLGAESSSEFVSNLNSNSKVQYDTEVSYQRELESLEVPNTDCADG